MAKEDFCFTYYDGDAARDMAHMNRLERGAYSDLIVSQRKFGHLSLNLVKKTLGNDFAAVWESLEIILKVDKDEKFFIEWLEQSVIKMKKQSVHQSENGKRGGRPKANENPNHNPNETQTITQEKPLENEDGNEYVNEDKEFGKSENLFWKDSKNSFLNSTDGWMYQFCSEKNIEERVLKKSMIEFITDIELQEDFKDLRALRGHFLNWHNKKYKNDYRKNNGGFAAGGGKLSSTAIIEPDKPFNPIL